MSNANFQQFQGKSCFSFILFADVDNAKEIRDSVMNGEFEATLLKPNMILDPFQVTVAANKAIHQRDCSKMTTKNVHSEILFCLSPTRNISQSFKKFGLGEDDQAVFVVVIDDQEGRVQSRIRDKVQGRQVDFNQVTEMTDIPAIKEVYKVTEKELSSCSLQDAIISRIASKEFVTV